MWSTENDSELDDLLEERKDKRDEWFSDLHDKFNNSSEEDNEDDKLAKTKRQEAD